MARDREETRAAQLGGLVLLSDVKDLKVAEGNPDVRGWDVLASDGTDVGEVKDLLVDPGAMKVRYLIVELDKEVAGTDDRRVLVPVGAARLDDEDDNVLLQSMALQAITGLPPYTATQFSRGYEDTLRERWGRGKAAAQAAGRDYYEHEHFDENRFYGRRGQGEQRLARVEEELAIGKRPVQAGEATVRKTVETEHVRQPVTKVREEVEIERRPVEGMTAGQAEIAEGEIRVPIMEEEVVVDKRPVVKEEVVVKKKAVEETEQVEAELRKERIDVDKSAQSTRDEVSERGVKRPRDEDTRTR
jgi:photosynthetic reaction center H subunit